ncbi:MAG: estB [Frankiales bacterium]|nr:estB [Frankiales bacterium]
MSPSRRLVIVSVIGVACIVAAVALLGRVLAGPSEVPVRGAEQSVEGPVLLVPGYGGATRGLEVLASALRAAGRTATVVPLPGDGTGDLGLSVAALDAAVALASAGPGPVDLVGYSAGGVVARIWAQDNASQVRRVVTLGSPHHGTKVAALGQAIAPGACPVACQQLVPGSPLLDQLNDEDETPDGPRWLALWTTQDETVTPPDSARLEGAVNVELQRLCPGISVTHGALPVDPTVTRVVLGALSGPELVAPAKTACA